MGSGRGQSRRVQARVVDPEDNVLRITGAVENWSDDFVLVESGDHGVVEYSLAEEALKHGLLGKNVVLKIDDAVKVISESRVAVRFRGLLSVDDKARLCFDGESWTRQLAVSPRDRVHLELRLAESVLVEPSKLTF